MAFLCFPLVVGRMRITIFHFLLSCTLVFSLLWGYLIVTVISRCKWQMLGIFLISFTYISHLYVAAPSRRTR